MGTKPGVGEDSVIVDLPSEAGAAIETDMMLSALAPRSRDLVERMPIERRPSDVGATSVDPPRPNATSAGRSAKTRVAGVPMAEASHTPHPLDAGGPSPSKRIVAFMASVGLSFVIGLPVVLRVDGVWGPPRTSAPASSIAAPSAPRVAEVAPQSPSQATPPPADKPLANALTTSVPGPGAVTTPKTSAKTGPSAKSAPTSPMAAGGAPQAPTTTAPAVAVTPTAPPTPPTAPAAPATPTPTAPLQHGSLIQ